MVLSSSVTCNYIAVICVWLAKPDVTANTRNSLNVQTKWCLSEPRDVVSATSLVGYGHFVL